ncbi:MAG: hypothetical protein H6737_31820, partial [Alphaproteobacteria bacterium]|nr:hypothetical protein [Alphaproteobacteria bacterium]
HRYTTEISGTYLDSERRLVVVVHGREVPEAEMLDACALRRDSQSTDRPIDTVSYVFVDEAEARAHLHALWLRELECRCVVDGVEVRLDVGYAPEPVVPSWVPAVRERWQRILDGA